MSGAYWQESVEIAFDEIGKWDLIESLTDDERKQIGEALAGSYENYGLAHYTPPASDRFAAMEREWQQRVEDERDRTEAARRGAEKAVRRALRLMPSTNISVTDDGEVYRYDGRVERIA